MSKNGVSFDEALSEARIKGYAEADPSADIDGFDTCRKICILAATAFGELVPFEKVRTDGIRGVTTEMIREAERCGYTVKLIGRAAKTDSGTDIFCGPAFVRNDCLLAGIDGAMNAISVEGRASGKLVFAGNGAGKLPTADAVLSDIIDIVKNPGAENDSWKWGEPAHPGLCGTLPESLGKPVFE